MLKSMKLIHLVLEMMKFSLMTLGMMKKTSMISKMNSTFYIPVFLKIVFQVWNLAIVLKEKFSLSSFCLFVFCFLFCFSLFVCLVGWLVFLRQVFSV
uniref:Uncharacterized protein n=1 Tax=Mus spicilegus TaxID=10103 RepID=A0A8C6H2L2_MUSSI